MCHITCHFRCCVLHSKHHTQHSVLFWILQLIDMFSCKLTCFFQKQGELRNFDNVGIIIIIIKTCVQILDISHNFFFITDTGVGHQEMPVFFHLSGCMSLCLSYLKCTSLYSSRGIVLYGNCQFNTRIHYMFTSKSSLGNACAKVQQFFNTETQLAVLMWFQNHFYGCCASDF